MGFSSNLRNILLAGGATLLLAACTQGEEIASPGGTSTGGGATPAPTPSPTPTPGSSASCPTGFTCTDTAGNFLLAEVSGTLTSTTLFNVPGVAYRLNGRVDVGEDCGNDGTGGTPSILTIEPGVTIVGNSGDDYLVVNRCSRIEAAGTQDAPIIFTSQGDLDRQAAAQAIDPLSEDDGGDIFGEWGGLVILGRAPINRCLTTPGASDCTNTVEGVSPATLYGGSISGDNSGTLQYVQVRFAGFETVPNSGDELNGISFGGVGSGTTVSHIQVHNNADDGVEFFGGSVDVRYLVLTGNDDDSIDSDNGWNGSIQYAVVRQRSGGGDNGFEQSSASTAPDTNPTYANFTLYHEGDNDGNALRINSGHIGQWVNGVVKSTEECFRWQDAGDDDATFDGVGVDPSFNSVLFDCGTGGLTNEDPENAVATAAIAVGGNVEAASGVTGDIATFFEVTNAPAPFDNTSVGLEAASYVGAFGPEESVTDNWATGWTFGLFDTPSCPSFTTANGTITEFDGDIVPVCALSGTLTTTSSSPTVPDTYTLTRGVHYELQGRVDVGIDIGNLDAASDGALGDRAVLDIETGVTIFGDSGSDYLLINRGSQIEAAGSAANPIVFTSETDLVTDDSTVDRSDAISEWGGIVILGRAPINRCLTTAGAADCTNTVEGVTPATLYGGNKANDDSGTLSFVQVKYAGFETVPNSGDELNGISFGGVGDGTTVEYVQVHNNADDGFEFFGGTVNAKYLVFTGVDDDSIDSDNGWNGAVQFAIIEQDDDRGDNGFEQSSATTAPDTNPTYANFTLLHGGDGDGNAFRINSGHIGRWLNGVVNSTVACFRWQDSAGDGDGSYDGVNIDPSFDAVYFQCDGGLAIGGSGNTTSVPSDALTGGTLNDASFTTSLTSRFVNGANEMSAAPFAGSLNALDSFLVDTSYVGAVEDANDTWWSFACGLGGTTSPC